MADNCLIGIAAHIINDCDAAPIGGVDKVAYVFNRSDIATVTYDSTNRNLITGITLAALAKGYKIEGFKKNIDAGHDLVTSETNLDKFSQYVKFESWLIDSTTANNLDGLADLVVFIVNKNKGTAGDGAVNVYGLETGLYKTSDTRRNNDNDGNRIIELATQEGEGSSVSYHVYFDTALATTISNLEGFMAD